MQGRVVALPLAKTQCVQLYTRWFITPRATGINAGSVGLVAGYFNPTSALGNIAASINLLKQFGDTKVLSSPKLMVLNNQTAVLKVVDNLVYFTVQAQQSALAAVVGSTFNYYYHYTKYSASRRGDECNTAN